MSKTIFQTEYYYHIYNRGVEKREVFGDIEDYWRFLEGLREFNRIDSIDSLYHLKQQRRKANGEVELLYRSSTSPLAPAPLVEIICYCLNPNHYHLLLKQKIEKGIEKFMHKMGTSYTNYFNKKDNRSGSLFQGRYKTVPVKTNEQLIYVSAYIHGNPEIHQIAKAEDWQYSSYIDYLGKRKGTLVSKKVILDQFEDINEYKEYVGSVINNSREIKEELKKLRLE